MIWAPKHTPNTGTPEAMALAKYSRSELIAGYSSFADRAPPRAMMRSSSSSGGGSKSAKSGAPSKTLRGWRSKSRSTSTEV